MFEGSAAVNAESRGQLSLPELIPDAPKVPVECRYLLSILNRPKFIKLVLLLVQFPFPEGVHDFDTLAEYHDHQAQTKSRYLVKWWQKTAVLGAVFGNPSTRA